MRPLTHSRIFAVTFLLALLFTTSFPAFGTEPIRPKSNLYLLTIAVSPVSDSPRSSTEADEFQRTYLLASKNLYAHIFTTALRGESCSKETVLAAIYALASKATPEDSFVFYYSGSEHSTAEGTPAFQCYPTGTPSDDSISLYELWAATDAVACLTHTYIYIPHARSNFLTLLASLNNPPADIHRPIARKYTYISESLPQSTTNLPRSPLSDFLNTRLQNLTSPSNLDNRVLTNTELMRDVLRSYDHFCRIAEVDGPAGPILNTNAPETPIASVLPITPAIDVQAIHLTPADILERSGSTANISVAVSDDDIGSIKDVSVNGVVTRYREDSKTYDCILHNVTPGVYHVSIQITLLDDTTAVKELDITTTDPQAPHLLIGRRLALLIDSSVYDDSAFTALFSPPHDVDALGEVLRSNYGFTTTTIRGVSATQETILNELNKYLLDLPLNADDQFIFYYSGHGVFKPGTELGAIVAKNSRSADRNLISYVKHSDIRDALLHYRCNQVLVILDSCASGAFDPRVMRRLSQTNISSFNNIYQYGPFATPIASQEDIARRINPYIKVPSRKYLTSSSSDFEGDADDVSPFTRELVRILSLRPADGFISFDSIRDDLVFHHGYLGDSFARNEILEDQGGSFFFVWKDTQE